MKEKAIAFIGGFITAIVPNAASVMQMFSDLAGKMFVTATLGVVGGISGLFAKEFLWPIIRSKLKR